MYIIYCKHIFVYIFFPCYFNWDASFVTEVLHTHTKEKKRKTEALCSSSVSARHSGCKKRLSLTWFALKTEKKKKKNPGRTRSRTLTSPEILFWPATLIHPPAKRVERRRRPPASGSLPFQKGSDGSSSSDGPASNQGPRSWRGCRSLREPKRKWRLFLSLYL